MLLTPLCKIINYLLVIFGTYVLCKHVKFNLLLYYIGGVFSPLGANNWDGDSGSVGMSPLAFPAFNASDRLRHSPASIDHNRSNSRVSELTPIVSKSY